MSLFDQKQDIKASGFYHYLPVGSEKRRIKEWSEESFHSISIKEAIQMIEGSDFEIPSLLDFWDMSRKGFDELGFKYNYHWCRESFIHSLSDGIESVTFKAYISFHTLFQYPVWRRENDLIALRLVRYE